jgi:hypothetical protein
MIFIDGLPILPFANPVIPGGTSPTDFLQVMGAFNTGAANSINVTYQLDGSGTFSAGISADDFFFIGEQARAPEPGILMLLGSGILLLFGATRRGRRSNP